jgi:hypothetical protein
LNAEWLCSYTQRFARLLLTVACAQSHCSAIY